MLSETATDRPGVSALRMIARFALFATAVTPLVLLPHFFFPFVTTRNIFFRLCVEAAFVLLLLSGVNRLRDVNAAGDRILGWFALYMGALAVTAITGFAMWHSVFGDFERMGGVFAWLHLFLFYCLLRGLMRESDWVSFFRLIVVIADVVVVWGALGFLPSSLRNPLFQETLAAGSTIGNQGLLGPLLLLASALAILDVFRATNRVWRIISSISLGILLFGIAGSRNRSSELGLLVGLTTAACVLLYYSTNRKVIAKRLAIVAGAVAPLLLAFSLAIRAYTPQLAEQFGGRWKGFLSSPVDHSRTIEWKIALAGFRDRPIVGYGPENHQIVASHHFDPVIYSVLGDAVFDRAHNAWLELLATSGLLGALAMAGIWIAALNAIRRGVREGAITIAEAVIFSGALAGYATYLSFWFFDINSVTLWVALLAYLSSRLTGILDVSARNSGRRAHPFAWLTIGVTLLAAYFHGIVPLRAAHDLSAAAEGGNFETRLMSFQKVLNSSAPQTMHTFPLYYRFLRSAEPEMARFGVNPFLRKEFELALQRGLIEADRSIKRNKSDDRSYVDAARLLSLAGLYYSDSRYVTLAKAELLTAVRISPRRPDARVLLSGVYQTLQDSIAAVAQLDTAMTLAPQFRPTFVYASRLQLARGNVDSSASLLLRAVSGRHLPVETQLRTVMDSLRARAEYARAAKLGSAYVEGVFGPLGAWRDPSGLPSGNAFAIETAGALPILYLRAGNDSLALEFAGGFARIQPASRSLVAQFYADIRSGHVARWMSRETLFVPRAITESSTAVRKM